MHGARGRLSTYPSVGRFRVGQSEPICVYKLESPVASEGIRNRCSGGCGHEGRSRSVMGAPRPVSRHPRENDHSDRVTEDDRHAPRCVGTAVLVAADVSLTIWLRPALQLHQERLQAGGATAGRSGQSCQDGNCQ